MNPQQPHHLVYSGPQYYSQHHPGPADSSLVRQENLINHSTPYSNPSSHGSHPAALLERPDPARAQSRSSNVYPNYGAPAEARPFDPLPAHHSTPLGIDTDLRNGRYTAQGPPATATRSSIPVWRDGHRYSAEGSFEHHFPPPGPPRQMPPPSSPQHFTSRSQHAPPPSLPPPTPTSATNRDLPSITSFNTRPGSSMSISSMLGADTERPRDPPASSASYSLPSINQGTQIATTHPGVSMSPPRMMSRHPSGEYPHMTRARTPERFGYSAPPAPRQHRSSSGGASSFGRVSIDDQYPLSTPISGHKYNEPNRVPFASEPARRPLDDFEHTRRSSLSGPLPRPNSQPHPQHISSVSSAFAVPHSRETTASEHRLSDPDGPSTRRDQVFQPRRQESLLQEAYPRDTTRQSSAAAFEYRPTYSGISTHPTQVEKVEERKPFGPWDMPSSSPTLRRFNQVEPVPSGPFESPSRVVTAPPEPQRRPSPPAYTLHPQSRLDQSARVEKQPFSERQEVNQQHPYSPFSTSNSHQQLPPFGAEEQNRRLGEELPQHRSLLNVANDNKRGGRASPVPQAVQGAQAQIVGPEAAIKSEHGRVFSGIGGGVGSVSVGPPRTSTPTAQTASPFRREEIASRVLVDDQTIKPSRSSSGVGKRGRRAREEELRIGSEPVDGRRTPISSRGAKKVRPPSTHATRHTNIRIKAVINSVASRPRRHLGSFLYSPTFSVPDQASSRRSKVNFSVTPSLLPSFADDDQLNCTYTIRVSRTWLTDSVREAVWKERFLWGSGIYTDDSDPVAAAFHSGFIKAAWPDGTDTDLLQNIIKEQNPKIDFAENVPPWPTDPPSDKDLHIILLVLPTLESYKSTTRFGIKSRDWPESHEDRGRHDGVSFAVLNCEWTDEGGSRGEERGGRARRERLKAKLRNGMETAPQGYSYQERDLPVGIVSRLRMMEDL